MLVNEWFSYVETPHPKTKKENGATFLKKKKRAVTERAAAGTLYCCVTMVGELRSRAVTDTSKSFPYTKRTIN